MDYFYELQIPYQNSQCLLFLKSISRLTAVFLLINKPPSYDLAVYDYAVPKIISNPKYIFPTNKWDKNR